MMKEAWKRLFLQQKETCDKQSIVYKQHLLDLVQLAENMFLKFVMFQTSM